MRPVAQRLTRGGETPHIQEDAAGQVQAVDIAISRPILSVGMFDAIEAQPEWLRELRRDRWITRPQPFRKLGRDGPIVTQLPGAESPEETSLGNDRSAAAHDPAAKQRDASAER